MDNHQLSRASTKAETDEHGRLTATTNSPLAVTMLALAACDAADTAFAVLNLCDDLTPQARRALGEAWVLVQEAIGASRGPDALHVQAARENRAVLRGRLAAEAVDRFRAAVDEGADPASARESAILAAAVGPPPTEDGESVWDLARQCVSDWPDLDTDEPVSGAAMIEWFAGMRERFRRALMNSHRNSGPSVEPR